MYSTSDLGKLFQKYRMMREEVLARLRAARKAVEVLGTSPEDCHAMLWLTDGLVDIAMVPGKEDSFFLSQIETLKNNRSHRISVEDVERVRLELLKCLDRRIAIPDGYPNG